MGEAGRWGARPGGALGDQPGRNGRGSVGAPVSHVELCAPPQTLGAQTLVDTYTGPRREALVGLPPPPSPEWEPL
eukprot:4750098-Alexandrium_andersonii.AAC.1